MLTRRWSLAYSSATGTGRVANETVPPGSDSPSIVRRHVKRAAGASVALLVVDLDPAKLLSYRLT